ncbi:dihydrofolate reductase [Mycoplasma sp. Ms02]|uniref:dihydrofolate reductase n=1 Tax=Mycoplasma sp. Ms02 TaxID=353851 RepID=UPI001C89DB1A|nr:dihydrofolate reductase [Mycoplasma sp. Ms02]QZE12262.1 dihydrofolate reductase [Mycoplasma sp. Ms02]
MIKAILAMTKDGVIGKGNELPWDIPEELMHFKRVTDGKILLFGQNTFDNLKIKWGNRKVYVLTRNKELKSEDPNVKYINNLREVLKHYETGEKDLYICGGLEVYEQTLQYADEAIITLIKEDYEGDKVLNTYFWDWFTVEKVDAYQDFDVYYCKKKW